MAEDIYVQKTDITGDNESTEIVKLFNVLERIHLLDFVLPSIYAFTGGMAPVTRQVLVPKVDHVHPGAILSGQLAITYSLDTGAEGEFEIYNYTDEVIVANSQFTVTDDSGNWFYERGPLVVITEGKDYRIRGSRTVGTGNNKVYLEAAQLLVSYG